MRRTEWLIEQRRAAPAEGPLAVRRAELEGELAAERSQAERVAREQPSDARGSRSARTAAADGETRRARARLSAALARAAEAVDARFAELERELAADRLAAEAMAGELRECAACEAEIQAALRSAGETVTAAEVGAQRLRDQAAEAELELAGLCERLGLEAAPPQDAASPGEGATPGEAERAELGEDELAALRTRLERLSAGASSSARSTRWRRRSTPRRSPTSRSWSAAARTSRRRCASCAA